MKAELKAPTALDVVQSWEKAMRLAFQAVERIPDAQLMEMREEQHEKAEAEVHGNLALP
jgi:hypothetical protein